MKSIITIAMITLALCSGCTSNEPEPSDPIERGLRYLGGTIVIAAVAHAILRSK